MKLLFFWKKGEERHMMKVPFSPPDITEEEISEVSDAMRSDLLTTGP